MPNDHRLPGFNFNVEKSDAEGQNRRSLDLARAVYAAVIAEKPAGSSTRVVQRTRRATGESRAHPAHASSGVQRLFDW